MHRLLIAAALIAFLSSCDRNQPANTAQDKVVGVPDAAVPDANPAATVPTPSNEASTDDYVSKAAAINLFEIESSRIAEQRAANPETAGRWRVDFDEYALVDGPKLPLNSASPTQYFDSLKALGIDEAELDWQPVTRQPPAAAPAAAPREPAAHLSGAASVGKPLETPAAILMSAKALVAAQFGVAPEAVEISIRF